MDGAINRARGIVPYFSRAYSSPDTVPGTATARCPRVLRSGITLPAASRNIAGGGCERRGLAKVDEGLAAVGELQRHEAPAAEIARRRIDDRERITHRDRGVDRIAAAAQYIDTDTGGELPAR